MEITHIDYTGRTEEKPWKTSTQDGFLLPLFPGMW